MMEAGINMGQNRKVEFKVFTVPEWKQEEEYLREQHKNGWKFTKVDLLGIYHFVKAVPEDVVYQLDYNQDGIAHKSEYVQMFRDCGWEYLQDYVGYSYFRKPVAEMQGEEEIFCDYDSKLEMMKRVFRGRVKPLLVIFFCCLLPQLYIWVHMNDAMGRVITAIYGAEIGIYLVLFWKYGCKFYRYWMLRNEQERT